MSADPHLAIDGLEKIYPNGVTAVDELSLSLDRGELLVLVGPSGCGKSTTLRCVAGLEEPTAGDVRIAGESVVGRRPEDRDVAMVFQNYALYPHMTARANLAFGLRMTTDLSDGAVADRVETAAETLGIVDLLDQRPRSLSGGQQQRVALGRAIVRDPAVFLLDEPLSNLDATLRARTRTEIQELQRELDVTTVHVTHDQTEAMTMGDRIAVLDGGRLQQVGTPLECYHEPANRFVAGFVGEPSMNFLDLDLPPGADRLEGALSYPAVEPAREPARAAENGVTLGVRPEALRVGLPDDGDGDGDGDAATTFPGRVEVVEPVGERSFLHVALDAGPTLTASVPGAAAGADREGARVRLRIDPDRLHLFDAGDGRALVHPDRRSGGVSIPGTGAGDADAV